MKPDNVISLKVPNNLCRRMMSERRNMRRTLLMLATLVLFIVCWLPLNILNLGEDLNMPLRSWR